MTEKIQGEEATYVTTASHNRWIRMFITTCLTLLLAVASIWYAMNRSHQASIDDVTSEISNVQIHVEKTTGELSGTIKEVNADLQSHKVYQAITEDRMFKQLDRIEQHVQDWGRHHAIGE